MTTASGFLAQRKRPGISRTRLGQKEMIGYTRALTGAHVHIDCHVLGLGKGGFPEHTPSPKLHATVYIGNKICLVKLISLF